MNDYLLSCDWGTSSFRLFLVDVVVSEVLAEYHSDDGIAKVYGRSEGLDGTRRLSVYYSVLQSGIRDIEIRLKVSLKDVLVVISGMASSSIGMVELSYSTLPFSLGGENALVERMARYEGFPHDVLLISGLRSNHDVMRGEETQMIGMAINYREQEKNISEEAIWVLPGTHSKHIHVRSGSIVDFNTFMTGELFFTLSNYTILKNSIEIGSVESGIIDNKQFFEKGVEASLGHNLLNNLFKVRTNQLFQKIPKVSNRYFLSGLLIGYELSYLSDYRCDIILSEGSNLQNLYQIALTALNIRHKVVASQWVEHAALKGQLQIVKACGYL